jgi:endonuclease/exonuclease/phosphatase family metal-dependent hydrolase
MTAQAVRDLHADVLCLQEVDDLRAMRYFHDRYLRRALDEPYEHFALLQGNDGRGIDVGVMARRGFPIKVKSHASLTYRDLRLLDDDLRRAGAGEDDRIFKRDCLEVEVEVADRVLDVFVCHFKSMSGDRERTNPVRRAEAKAVRRIIERKFGPRTRHSNWLVCGDFNDQRSKILVRRGPDREPVWTVEPVDGNALEPLFAERFALDLVERLPWEERWTHWYGEAKELSQLDYLLASPALASANPKARPEILRRGLPYRVPVRPRNPDGTPFERYPRVGFDRPKASDHCPIVVELEIPDDGRRAA